MSNDKRYLLINQAARLVTLGIKVERERSKFVKLVTRGIPYTVPEMIKTLERL